MSRSALSIRLSRPGDAAALERLARVHNTAPPSGRALIAERHGVPVAALALTSGAVVTDPSRRGGDAVGLLRLRPLPAPAPGRRGRPPVVPDRARRRRGRLTRGLPGQRPPR